MPPPNGVLLFADDRFERHQTGAHPESPARLRSIRAALSAQGLDRRCREGPVRPATPQELARIHPAGYVESLRRLCAAGGGRLDPDTVASRDSCDVALLAAGTACAAADAVLAGQARAALCLVRPPGHHALSDRAMGFCLLNNVAVAAAHARDAHELGRLLIVDWDVHHGNGTQDLFYADGRVHFFSAHRYPFYPGSGASDETGTGPGLGTNLNLPLTFGIPRAEYVARFADALQTAADRCRPDLVLVSAGFDAHALDPIGSLGLESEDFAVLTGLVREVADQHCGGRIVSLLEGGYHMDALAESVAAHLAALLEERTGETDG